MGWRNVEAAKEYAGRVLEIAIRDGHFSDYAVGLAYYLLRDENGGYSEDAYYKMTAIHNYYRANPNSNLDRQLYEALEDFIPLVKGSDAFYHLLSVINFQLAAENEGRATFKMDVKPLLVLIEENLQKNHDLYTSDIYEKIYFLRNVRAQLDSIRRYIK